MKHLPFPQKPKDVTLTMQPGCTITLFKGLTFSIPYSEVAFLQQPQVGKAAEAYVTQWPPLAPMAFLVG